VISSAELCALIEPVAQHLLGDPNRSLSSKTEWRYGSRGSFCIDLRKGTFFDHETSKGGGVLDLIEREKGLKGPDRLQWLIDERLVHKPNGAAHKANGADHGGLGRIVATYDYIDENGVLLFQAVRYEPKDFRQRRPDLDHPGKWNWSIKGVRQVPYRLTELLEPLSLGRVVFIVEGEKDVNRLWSIGIPATCNAMGAGKWPEELNAIFAGADVVIIPDNDPQKRHPKTDAPMFHDDGRPILPGQDHAETVAAALIAVAAKVRVLDLAKVWPEMPLKGDVSDWLDNGGGSADALYKLIEGVPIWEPAAKPNGAAGEHTFDERSPPPPGEDAEAPVRISGIAEFLARYKPINYTIDGLLPGGSIYGVTAKRSAGKTAFLTSTALAVAADRSDIHGFDVEKGRVAYIILENPTDFLMKLAVTAFALGIDVQKLNDKFVIIDMKRSHEAIMRALRENAARFGPFQLVNYDTFQAGFPGANFNDNNDTLKHAQSLREFTTLPGKPSVLVACHPVKNPTRDNLEPYGGGSTMNEFDGNLTLWNEGGVIELHHNKVRGPEFEPINFRIEMLGSPDILDSKGRQPLLPVLRPVSAQDAEESQKAAVNNDVTLLKAMAADPDASIPALARETKINASSIKRALPRLATPKSGKLVASVFGKWTLTAAGLKAIEGRR
jgi:hypothetical protein